MYSISVTTDCLSKHAAALYWIRPLSIVIAVRSLHCPIHEHDCILAHQSSEIRGRIDVVHVPVQDTYNDQVTLDWFPGGPSGLVKYVVYSVRSNGPGEWQLLLKRLFSHYEQN